MYINVLYIYILHVVFKEDENMGKEMLLSKYWHTFYKCKQTTHKTHVNHTMFLYL